MDDSSTHWFGKVEDEEDRWKTGMSFSNHYSKNDLREQVHAHLDAWERRCETFFKLASLLGRRTRFRRDASEHRALSCNCVTGKTRLEGG